jgi:hypothetical protein
MAEIYSDKFRLPSWSWMSVDGPVIYPYARGFTIMSELFFHANDRQRFSKEIQPLKCDDLIARVERASVDLCYLDLTFGIVCCGLIEIKGLAFEVELSESNHLSAVRWPHIPKCYSLFNHQSLFGIRRESDHRVDPAFSGLVYFDWDPYKLPKVTLVCLRLGTGYSLLSGKEAELGLALLRTEESVPLGAKGPLFRRVGVFEVGLFNQKFLDTARVRTVQIV